MTPARPSGLVLSTPIIYPREIVPDRFACLIAANPMTHFVDLFRMPLYLGRVPDAGTAAVCVAWAVGALVVASWVFARKAHELAEAQRRGYAT